MQQQQIYTDTLSKIIPRLLRRYTAGEPQNKLTVQSMYLRKLGRQEEAENFALLQFFPNNPIWPQREINPPPPLALNSLSTGV
jgi:hypothetical protein